MTARAARRRAKRRGGDTLWFRGYGPAAQHHATFGGRNPFRRWRRALVRVQRARSARAVWRIVEEMSR